VMKAASFVIHFTLLHCKGTTGGVGGGRGELSPQRDVLDTERERAFSKAVSSPVSQVSQVGVSA